MHKVYDLFENNFNILSTLLTIVLLSQFYVWIVLFINYKNINLIFWKTQKNKSLNFWAHIGRIFTIYSDELTEHFSHIFLILQDFFVSDNYNKYDEDFLEENTSVVSWENDELVPFNFRLNLMPIIRN